MARTQDEGVVTETTAADLDGEAWREAAATRKYRVDGGQVWAFSGGKLFPVPAPEGFAGLGKAIRPLIAQALLQFVQNRVGQKAGSGVSAVDAAIKAIAEGEVSNAQTNDAFDSAHRHGITAKIEAKYGALPDDATKEVKAARATAISDTAIARKDLMETHVAEAKAAGAETGTASVTARKPKAAGKAALEL